ncbi:octaprenyl diphosphate synthase [Thiofaba sp. EF100]|uniref:octaprenyl diphosphate synthase n=1 Tax=Thiofaba sp. EF100 TaxID=3121274 RepID=UPI0032219791
MNLEQVRSVTADDMARVNQLIERSLHSEVALVRQIATYIIHGGGKRLRPLLHLLAARAAGYTGEHHYTLAAVIEFIHTSTLLHDDVVDESGMRRGRKTANAMFGNAASVLVGDFLYSRAFQLMVSVGSMRVMEILADATNIIAEGEVMQLMNCHDPDTTEVRYMEVIRCKTAQLFEAAGRLGAVLAGAAPEIEAALAAYGLHLGNAFQLMDDALDYEADPEKLGKNVGDDLAEGKPTLPLIHALRHAEPEQAAVIRQAIEQGGVDHLPVVLEAIAKAGSLAYTARLAMNEAEQAVAALAILPPSPQREALESIARFAAARDH